MLPTIVPFVDGTWPFALVVIVPGRGGPPELRCISTTLRTVAVVLAESTMLDNVELLLLLILCCAASLLSVTAVVVVVVVSERWWEGLV